MISSVVRFVDAVVLLTTVSKLHIENRLVRISAGMVGILLNSCSPREHSNELTPASGVGLEGTTARVGMSYGVA